MRHLELWLEELKDAVYDADDLLDEFVTLIGMKRGGKPRKSDYNREAELKAFDNTKAGVKGLVDGDAGVGSSTIPRIFIQPPEDLIESCGIHNADLQVPVIDLAGLDNVNDRGRIVEELLYASEKWGFFQVVNHGIPLDVLDNMLKGVRVFHEQDSEVKKEFYSRDRKQVVYNSNYDLYKSKAANWVDTLTVNNSYTGHLDPETIPAICRGEVLAYANHVLKLGDVVLELLSMALGLRPECLKQMEADKGWSCVGHYYPACPQPELALGAVKHTDFSFITVLVQDQIGGPQVFYESQWVDVLPIPGALVINIGALLQIISNDKFKSVWHRVKANRVSPRISAAFFFSGVGTSPKLYAPIKELLSEENPPIYREFTIAEYLANFFSRPVIEARYKDFMIDCNEGSN